MSTLRAAHSHIMHFIVGCGRRVWTYQQLANALNQMREDWQLARRVDTDLFIEYLLAEASFVKVELDFPSRPSLRYWWQTPSVYELVLSLRETGYFSHHTAAHLHDLIEHEPHIIYFNIEQQNRGARSSTDIKQAGIDTAFRRPVRTSQCRAEYADKTICLLSGKNTGNYGVISRKHPECGQIRYTNLPRTLIDIVVRPEYSGGVNEVLGAYQRAAGRFDVADLLRALSEIEHAYPYHQAIGFYMDRAGNYKPEELEQIRSLGLNYDFYLDYEMDEPGYSKEWRIYYPKELDSL